MKRYNSYFERFTLLACIYTLFRPDNSVVDGRIIGGTLVGINAYPYYVFPDPTSNYICGGVLIWQDIVLTAAHCRTSFRDTFQVCLGGNDLACQTSRGLYNLTEMVQHPGYSSVDLLNDVMLMKLSEPAPGPYATLNLNASAPELDESIVAIGYGQTDVGDDADLSDNLLRVAVETFPYGPCKAFWLDVKERPLVGAARALCTGTETGGRDACFGDSGGPLFLANTDTVAGITSYGRGCGRANTPAVNVRISGYAAWIQNNVCALSSNPPPYCSDIL